MEREEVIEKVIAVIRDVMDVAQVEIDEDTENAGGPQHRFAGLLQSARRTGIEFPHPHAGEGTRKYRDSR